VIGTLHKFHEIVLFDITSIRPVEDPYEVFFHFMEAIVVTLQRSKGQPVCTFSPLPTASFVSISVCATAKTLRLAVCGDGGPPTSSPHRRARSEYIHAIADRQHFTVARFVPSTG
jgi:hypothetical protein